MQAAILNMGWVGERKPSGIQKARENGFRKIWFAQNLQPGILSDRVVIGCTSKPKTTPSDVGSEADPLSSKRSLLRYPGSVPDPPA